MKPKHNDRQLRQLLAHFGVEKLIAALPQDEVRKALDLVSTQEVAQMLGMNYNTFHWHMAEGHIPFPQIRLVRRAYFTRNEADAIVQDWTQKNRCWRSPAESGK